MDSISVIVPSYNEEKTVKLFYDEMKRIMKKMNEIDFESIFVDDGSKVFFASTFWRKMQNIFGECCISKLEKVARPRLAAILPAT